MNDLFDGLERGTKDWKNVQSIVRTAFCVMFGEVVQMKEMMSTLGKSDDLNNRMTSAERNIKVITRRLDDHQCRLDNFKQTSDNQTESFSRLKAKVAGLNTDIATIQKQVSQPESVVESTNSHNQHILYLQKLNEIKEFVDMRLSQKSIETDTSNILERSQGVTWLCKPSCLKVNKNRIEWTSTVGSNSSSPKVLSWNTSKPHIINVIREGLYEISCGVFSNSDTPHVTICVNDDDVFVSTTCKSFVTKTRSSSRLLERCVSGQTISDFVWLPASASISIKLQSRISSMKECFLALRPLIIH